MMVIWIIDILNDIREFWRRFNLINPNHELATDVIGC